MVPIFRTIHEALTLGGDGLAVEGRRGVGAGGAGAAGLLKTVLALHHGEIPPSLGFAAPNPNIDFRDNPFRVNTTLEEWELNGHEVRRAGVSAFGFGGTNFHAVLEEYVPGRLQTGSSAAAASSCCPCSMSWVASS